MKTMIKNTTKTPKIKRYTTSEARQNFAGIIDGIVHRNVPVIIERHNRPQVVMMKYDDDLPSDYDMMRLANLSGVFDDD